MKCPNGHEWEHESGSKEKNDPAAGVCPICGLEPEWDTLPSPDAITMPTEEPTAQGLSEEESDGRPPTTVDHLPGNIRAQPGAKTVGHHARTVSDRGYVEEEDPATLISKTPPIRFHDPVSAPVPGYDILEVLGKGGMGTVFKARQHGLNRMVALKTLHSHLSEKSRARFRAEAQAIAQLQHANIVQIFEIGEWQVEESGTPVPYFAMEYVAGGSLAQALRRRHFTPRQAAQLIETLAGAAHYAHQQGILHRDLKPANVLLSVVSGPLSVAGAAKDQPRTTDQEQRTIPKITDFGLVKRIEELQASQDGSQLTDTGEVLGTPSYMAPEQAAAGKRGIGPATDVYALGAILYELLTHEPPFEADTPMQTVLQVLEEEPLQPREIDADIPRDLQTICLTCLQKDPARRYVSAEALADDLRAFLAGEPIQARSPAWWERAFASFRKRPVLALAAGVGAIAAVGLLAGLFMHNVLAAGAAAVVGMLMATWWYNARLQKALRNADEEHLQAERGLVRLHLLLETTQELMKANDLDELLELLSQTTTRMVNAERATIFLIDENKNELWSKVAMGDGMGEIRVQMGEGVAGIVAQSGEVVNLKDPYHDPRFNPEIDRRTGYKTRNLLTLPMRAGNGHIVGVFQVLNKRAGAFQSDDIKILQALATSAAIAVENAGPASVEP